jgi:uncharacterized zinc-type alcohol dehydrogenase-like protein
MESHGRAAMEAGGRLEPFEFQRREAGSDDVVLELLHCGICHSDLHYVNNDWGFTTYPIVPGHEIVGRVTHVGPDVSKFNVGDLAAIGCLVDSCRKCPACEAGQQHACEAFPTPTYGGFERDSDVPTYGGYSNNYVINEDFALKLRDDVDPAGVAPLLCAGITTYSPLRHWQVGEGQSIGVVGLGGLGHVAVKIGKALGAEVVVFTTSPSKADDARRLGADDVVLSTDAKDMKRRRGELSFIIDTVSGEHDVNGLLKMLQRDGTLCLVGMPDKALVSPALLVGGRKRVAGSAIGGIRETQEMLDFCTDHGIVADVEAIGVDQINDAYARMLRNDVKYRFVIDLESLSA